MNGSSMEDEQWHRIEYDPERNYDLPSSPFADNHPCIYFLCDDSNCCPLYVGEYGQAKSYSVYHRIRQHFWSSTLGRLHHNLSAFQCDVPDEVVAHIRGLDSTFRDRGRRQSLEAWIIFLVCHVHKVQDPRFAVTKYRAPNDDAGLRAQGELILAEFWDRAN
jgi:hypothetical protein